MHVRPTDPINDLREDDDEALAGMTPTCPATSPEHPFGCTRPVGHARQHIAAGVESIYARWDDDTQAESA